MGCKQRIKSECCRPLASESSLGASRALMLTFHSKGGLPGLAGAITRGIHCEASNTMGSQSNIKSECCKPLSSIEASALVPTFHTQGGLPGLASTPRQSLGDPSEASNTMGSHPSIKSKCCIPLGIREQFGGLRCLYIHSQGGLRGLAATPTGSLGVSIVRPPTLWLASQA
jgi:hypothetical protein